MNLAIVTGASSGIGRASALAFSEAGYRAVNISRRSANAENITDMRCDIGDPQALDAIIEELREEIAKADSVCLIHNACRMAKDSVSECDPGELRQTLAVNIEAPNQINQALLPVLPTGSSVIYIGSTLSEKAVAGAFSYVMSKHASVGMMRATCQDLAGKGIHTACVCPGFTDTQMLRDHVGNQADVLEAIAGMNAAGRLIEDVEIAELILWAHRNPVINGSVLHAHLGQLES